MGSDTSRQVGECGIAVLRGSLCFHWLYFERELFLDVLVTLHFFL